MAVSMFKFSVSQEKGRGLKCTKTIKQGTTILKSDPFVHVLSSKQKGVRCDHCTAEKSNLLRCSGCKLMRYCGKPCQKNAWAYHKHECAALKRIHPKVPPDFVLLLGRVLWQLENSIDDKESDQNIVNIMDLESNYDRLSEAQKETLGKYVVILHSYWGLGKLPIQVQGIRAVLELCARLKNNCFAICDEELQSDIGTGVYLSCSILNHSCLPNCVPAFDGVRLHIRALRDIYPGEELMISYINQFAPAEERFEELQSIYRFQCRCEACCVKLYEDKMMSDTDGSLLTLKSEKIRNVRDLLRDLEELQSAGKHEEVLKLAAGYISRKVLPSVNVYTARVHDFGMDAAIKAEKYDEACCHGFRALRGYQAYLPDIHPLTGIQMMKLGKILLLIDQKQTSRTLLHEALNILRVTHCDKGKILRQLRVLIDQCHFEIENERPKK